MKRLLKDKLSEHFEYWLSTLHFDLLITRECNCRCQHCMHDSYNGILPFSKFLSTIDQLEILKVERIYLTGGEIFFHPEIAKILQRIKNSTISFSAVTNGTSITNEIARLVYEANMHISISLDGPEHFHNTFRNHDSCYLGVLDAIKNLKSQSVEPSIIFTVVPENLQYLDWVINFCLENKIKRLRIQPVSEVGHALVRKEISGSLSSLDYDSIYEKAVLASATNVGQLIIEALGHFKNEILEHPCQFGLRFCNDCHSFTPPWPKRISIHPEGDMYPLSLKTQRKYKVGELENSSIRTTLHNYYTSDEHLNFLIMLHETLETKVKKTDRNYIDFANMLTTEMSIRNTINDN